MLRPSSAQDLKSMNMKTLLYILSASLLIIRCQEENEYLPPDFDYDIPQVNITENVMVGAYYHSYTDIDWGATADTSVLGPYSSLDASVMEQERQWADDAGVDFLIFNWNGAADDALLQTFIDGRSSNVKMVINYNLNHLNATNSSPLTGDKLTMMTDEIKSLASAHFNNDYYFKSEDQPVVFISPLNVPSNALTSIDFTVVIPAVRDALNSIGTNPYFLGEITSGWLPPQRYSTSIRAMDAVALSDWSTDVYDRAVFMPPFLDMNWKHWTDSTTVWGIDYVPCIFQGYDEKAVQPKSKKYTIDRSVEFYTDLCNVAKRNMSDRRIVLTNSWNNFDVATELEPSEEYGTTYLEVTRKQFKIN